MVVRRTFLEVPVDPHSQSDADDSDEDVLVHVRSRRRPKTTTAAGQKGEVGSMLCGEVEEYKNVHRDDGDGWFPVLKRILFRFV